MPPPSTMATDPRRIVGSMVEAKACHVTNLAECARRYGSNSKTKRVQGVVTHVEVVKNPTTNRTTTFVTAAYDLGGTTIRPSRLNIRSVKAVSPPTAATVPTATGTLLGSTDGDSTTTEKRHHQHPQNLRWRRPRMLTHLRRNLLTMW